MSGRVVLKSALGKAIHYLLEKWSYLIRYPEDGAWASAVMYSLIETTKENGLDPYRYLLWGLQSAPKLSEMDTTWEEHLTPSTHWINAGCQKIKESWLVPALLYCALSGSTVTIKVH